MCRRSGRVGEAELIVKQEEGLQLVKESVLEVKQLNKSDLP